MAGHLPSRQEFPNFLNERLNQLFVFSSAFFA